MSQSGFSNQAPRPLRIYNRVALLAPAGREANAIAESYKKSGKFALTEFHSLDEVNDALAKSCEFDVLVMRMPVFQEPQVVMVKKARARFPYSGLITISPEIEPSARYLIKDVPRHKLLLESFEIADLAKLTEKLVRGEPSAARLHPRVAREGECEIICPEQGARIKGHFLDFAQMGTRLLVQPRVPLKKGARVELQYRSTSEPSRIHRIQSGVVWAEMSGGIVGTLMHGPQQMIGVRFIAAL